MRQEITVWLYNVYNDYHLAGVWTVDITALSQPVSDLLRVSSDPDIQLVVTSWLLTLPHREKRRQEASQSVMCYQITSAEYFSFHFISSNCTYTIYCSMRKWFIFCKKSTAYPSFEAPRLVVLFLLCLSPDDMCVSIISMITPGLTSSS